ncbi:MAG: ABC-F family ATP-binding cassette domain-containing protein [Hyphomicrobiaceae bacterium]|nr:ABC-F family ATP-binding cassette domain-containing protein [Hyphomicrobiaceae bacterium]
MAPPLLQLTDIHLTFGGTPLLTGAGLDVSPGERLALVGRNGSGKSTLLRIAAGLVEPDGGQVFVQPGIRLAYLEQSPDLTRHARLLDYLEAAGLPIEPHRLGHLSERLGLDPEADPKRFSGGEQRRAALLRALVGDPDVLLLDEPTNHLDLPAIEWLESELLESRAAMVLISHDRRFLENLSTATLWLDRGRTRSLDQGFAAFEQWRDRMLDEEAEAQHKLARKIAAEEHWLRYGVTARRKRNVRRLAGLQALREKHRTHRGPEGNVGFTLAEGGRAGAIVIDAKGLGKSFGARTIVAGLDLRLMRGDCLAIVGPNGAGKTTLLNLLLGDLPPDEGTVTRGSGVELAHLDQTRTRVPPETPLADVLTGGGRDTLEVDGKPRHVTAYMKDFLFPPEQMRTPFGKLSGGEKARLLLAQLLAAPSNLLVLDEPTNDLDLETLDLLEELVADYPGTVILVSHDRDFIDRVATRTLIAEGDGRWTLYAGGYADMLALRRNEAPERIAARSPDKVAAVPSGPAEPKQQRKLSFKQKHALQTLPREIDDLTKTIAKLHHTLADGGLYARDPERFSKLGNELAAAEAAREQKESEWLELEILREELEG